MAQALIARQPIFDQRQHVFGYELLYRGPEGGESTWDGNRASSSVLLEVLNQGHGSELLGQEKAFINLTRTLLGDLARLPLTREGMVLEVLEDIEVDEDLVSLVAWLKEAGYQVALDDFVLSEENYVLIKHADIIKVDIQLLSWDELRYQARQLAQHPVHLVAEKVETHEERDLCEELGFEYFQGFFFARPEKMSGSKLPPDRARILQLMERIHDPSVELSELKAIILHDVALSYSILRLINSAYFPTRTRVESVQHAVALLGVEGTRAWLTVIAMSYLGNKPRELQVQGLLRARMTSKVGGLLGESPNRAFLVGLLSILDALMDRPLTDLLDQIPIVNSVRKALLERSGLLGEALALVLSYERGQWADLEEAALSPGQIGQAYLDALDWAQRFAD